MAAIEPRMTRVAVVAAVNAVLIAWTLRSSAEFLPDGRTTPHMLIAAASPRHGHADGSPVYEPPPAVTGDALANYTGLAVVALHLMLVGVTAAAWGSGRWFRRSFVDAHRVLVWVAFAASVAVVSASVTVVTGALLGSAISFTATVSASVTVLRYSFVVALVSLAVLGMPYRLSGKDRQCSTDGTP